MSLVFKYRGPDGDFIDITDNVRLFTKGDSETSLIELTENSEEGSVAISTVLIDDPDVSIEIPPHRAFFAMETEVASGEDRIYSGYTADRVYKPLEGVSTQGRLITLSVADINSVWGRRVMIGADSKRAAETDVHRMRWLDSTAEAGLIDDDTYLSAAAPKDMDKVDYRVQMMDSVANDASQASGKNWGLTYNFVDGDGYQIWYGADELATYDSGCLLTNDPSVFNGTDTFIIADDTEIALDPKRIYSGVAVPWAKGTVYQQRAATAHDFARRDVIMPSPNVKTKTKAIARANRYLDSFKEEDLRIETRYWVAAEHVNAIRPFMRVQFQSSMALETAEPIYCRVLRRTVKLWKPGIYEIGLTLAGGASVPDCGGVVQSAWSTEGGTSVVVTLPSAPTIGNTIVSILDHRSETEYDPPFAIDGGGLPIVGTDYDADGIAADYQAIQAAHRVVTSDDTVDLRWDSLAGSSEPVAYAVEIKGNGGTVQGPFIQTGDDALTMTLSGVTVDGPGILVVAFGISDFNIPPHTLTPPSGLVNVVPEGYNRHDFATQDWQSSGYIEIAAAGTYSYSWSISNTFLWKYQIIGLFVPADLCE